MRCLFQCFILPDKNSITINKTKKASGFDGNLKKVFENYAEKQVVAHEDKHRKNNSIYNKFGKDKIGRLSMEQLIHIAIYDEVSAKMSELMHLRSEYIKNGYFFNPFRILQIDSDAKLVKKKLNKMNNKEIYDLCKKSHEHNKKNFDNKKLVTIFDFYENRLTPTNQTNPLSETYNPEIEKKMICQEVYCLWIQNYFEIYNSGIFAHAAKMYMESGGKGISEERRVGK